MLDRIWLGIAVGVGLNLGLIIATYAAMRLLWWRKGWSWRSRPCDADDRAPLFLPGIAGDYAWEMATKR